jgi:hypothetical protein
MARNPQYLAKKQADEDSYVWDGLIEAFTSHMLDGTTIVPDGQPFVLFELEEGVRHMAVVPRHLWRMLGDGILDALRKGTKADRFTRGFLPRPNDPEQDTGFFFMTLSVPAFKLTHGCEHYRSVRRAMLETYAFSFLQKNPKLKQIVGIATEPPMRDQGSSEDTIVVYTPEEWTPDFLMKLEEQKRFATFPSPGITQNMRSKGTSFRKFRGDLLKGTGHI